MSLVSEIFGLPFSRRQKALMADRCAISIKEFIRELASDSFEEEVALRLWRHLQEEACVPDFRPLPEDSLSYIYGIADEELDEDILAKFALELGVNWPSGVDIRAFGPVNTPRDVVRFLSWARSLNQPEES